MIGSRLAVRVAHYDGLGAHDVVEALAALEREAGCASDLGWVSEAMLEPTFRLVTAARADRLRGYAAATRRGVRVELQRLVAVADPNLDETQVCALLVDAVLRVAGRPPYRELDTFRESGVLPMLERLGWRAVQPDDRLAPCAPADDAARVTLSKRAAGRW